MSYVVVCYFFTTVLECVVVSIKSKWCWQLLYNLSGLGSNTTRSSPSDQAFAQLNDSNHQQQQHHLQANASAPKMNVPQQQLQMQQQQMMQQQQQTGGLNQHIQQPQNVYFTAADG